MKLPPEVLEVFQLMKTKGRQAYLAGGCIRDHFLNRVPKDYDWAVDANQEELLEWIPNSTKNWFGVKLRTEGKVNMDIMPMVSCIEPFTRTDNIISDLRRRLDFTFSIMAYNPKTGFISLNNAKEDCLNKIMRLNKLPGMTDEDVISSNPGLILKAINLNYRLGIEPSSMLKSLMSKHVKDLYTWRPERHDWVERHIERARQLGTSLVKEIGL